MRIIISPAKKMNVDTDSFLPESLPIFLEDAEYLKGIMCTMTPEQLKRLWKCSDSLVELNIQRLSQMDLRHHLTPAIMSYEGIQYQYMAPDVMETEQLAYIQAHLRILSGLYGVLKPFDGVSPYRLEMQSRLAVGTADDLYKFWNSRIADQLRTECSWILNLASKEYSKAVKKYLPQDIPFITCSFAELQEGKPVEKGTFCKMARGAMVRWLAEHNSTEPGEVKAFNQMGYTFSEVYSTEKEFVFLKRDK